MGYRKFALYLVGLVMAASACSALTPDNPVATLQTERQGYVDESTSIAQAAQVQGTQVGATAVAAQTYVAQMEGRNQELVATLRIALPPTEALINDTGPVTPGSLATPAPAGFLDSVVTQPPAGQTAAPNASLGDTQFTQVGTASSVRNSDGCADTLATAFAANVQKIYITTRALKIKQGTVMRVEWDYKSQVASSETWTVPADHADICLWFFLTPTATTFAPGDWSVQLFANDQPIDPKVNFTIGA